MRIVIADLYAREWQGGGRFWTVGRRLYHPFGGVWPPVVHVATAASVRAVAYNFSHPTFFSLERLGYVSERCGADWALVQRNSPGLKLLAQGYDLVLAAPQLLGGTAASVAAEPGRVVVLLDEPKSEMRGHGGGLSAVEALAHAQRSGACATCALAHFARSPPPPGATIAARELPPPYEVSLFQPYVRPARARFGRYMLARRSYWAGETRTLMRSLRYRYAVQEAWSTHTDATSMSQGAYLRRLAGCRWLLDIEFKRSAGQLIAEASLLGVPSIAGRGRANAERLLPSHLLVPRNATASEALATVNRTIRCALRCSARNVAAASRRVLPPPTAPNGRTRRGGAPQHCTCAPLSALAAASHSPS